MSAPQKRHRISPNRTISTQAGEPRLCLATASADTVSDALLALTRLLARQTARSIAGADADIKQKDDDL